METRTIGLPDPNAPKRLWRVLIVVSEFNALVTDRLLSGCLESLAESALPPDRVDVVRVPGAMEIPSTLSVLLPDSDYGCAIALGCVIRGETGHYDAVVQGVTDGIMRQSQLHRKAIVFGILTVNSLQQAMDRLGGREGHKGREAGETACRMADLFHRFSESGCR
ncbi:MAG: 6,7-dimethyl-8-ribityllumazine synthase [Leptospirales bacterium]